MHNNSWLHIIEYKISLLLSLNKLIQKYVEEEYVAYQFSSAGETSLYLELCQ